jgi:hypothetical protein
MIHMKYNLIYTQYIFWIYIYREIEIDTFEFGTQGHIQRHIPSMCQGHRQRHIPMHVSMCKQARVPGLWVKAGVTCVREPVCGAGTQKDTQRQTQTQGPRHRHRGWNTWQGHTQTYIHTATETGTQTQKQARTRFRSYPPDFSSWSPPLPSSPDPSTSGIDTYDHCYY